MVEEGTTRESGPPERRQTPHDPHGIQYGRRRTDKPAMRKSQFFVTFCHWSMVALLIIETVTGMRMGWGYAQSPLGGPAGFWSPLLNSLAPRGEFFGFNIMTVHNIGAWLLLVDVIVYLVYLFRSRAFKRISVSSSDIQTVKQFADNGDFWQSKKALWSANLLVYWFGFLAIFILLATGVALYRVDLGWHHYMGGYWMTRFLHTLFTYLFLPFTVLHVLLQWRFGTLWSIFRVSFHGRHFAAGCLGLTLAAVVVSGLYRWNQMAETLKVRPLAARQSAPLIDGDPNDKAWQSAQTIVIKTVKGVNFPTDEIDISVTALHDGKEIYFRFQWDDPDLSVKRLPLLKSPEGWMVMQTGVERKNENTYYEDQLAVYLTTLGNNRGCASSCHLGAGGADNPKGVHYTDGEIADLWHWRAIGSNSTGSLKSALGLVADEYIGPAKPLPEDGAARYSGGLDLDPGVGGYRQNFTKLETTKPLSQTKVLPVKLPAALPVKLTLDLKSVELDGPWWIADSTGVSYARALDHYPLWTVLPSVLVTPLQGDRGNVGSRARWHKGRWTVEMKRVLDTKSKFDIAFKPGTSVYMSVAAFNRTETRHSEHLRPIRLQIQR